LQDTQHVTRLLPGVKLIDVSCTSLVHKEVGGSERAVRRLFQAARAAAPCILLMDGLENVAAVRGYDNTTEGTMDRVLSTLLTELDGVDNGTQQSTGGKIAVIGITHDKHKIDPALRRPGRLEKVIDLQSPDLQTREDILRRELFRFKDLVRQKESGIEFDHLVSTLAEHTDGFTGAEVVARCNDGRMRCLRETLLFENGAELVELSLKLDHFISP